MRIILLVATFRPHRTPLNILFSYIQIPSKDTAFDQ